ncbi:glycosyltransferase family 2 protein [soil metagenome]
MSQIKLTIVSPVFNEEAVIEQFHVCISNILNGMDNVDAYIIYVVDKSTDNTLEILRSIAKTDPRTTVLSMSSRFGHQMSLFAGIEHSLDSDAIIMMDSDMQHPPALIPELLRHFQNGIDVVYTLRIDTQVISHPRKIMGNLFYKILNKISDVPINPNSADFRLISRRVAKVLTEGFSERNMFLRGLFSWIGFKQIGIEYTVEKRAAGVSKYSFSRMMQLALSGVLSFSTKPLQIGVFAGVFFGFTAVLLMIVTIVNYFVAHSLPSGWTTLVTLLLFFSAIQLMVTGIVGIYLGGIYEEIKNRPRYIIDEEIKHYD